MTLEKMVSPIPSLLTRHPALACVLLGAVAACGFAPLQLWPLTLACLAAWMWLVHDAASLKQALWRGWAFGVGHFTINDNWFQHAFEFQDKMPPALGYAAPLALALYLAAYTAITAGLAWRYGRRATRPDVGYTLVFGAAWIVGEYLRATTFTGYAWDPLGVIWVPVQPVAALTALVGTYALSGLTVVVAGALLLVPRRRWPIAATGAALVVLLVAQSLSYRATAQTASPSAPRIRIVQPNVSQDQRGEGDDAIRAKLIALSGKPGPAPRLVVWPEGVIDDPLEDGYPDWIYDTTTAPLTRLNLAMPLGPRDLLLTGGTAYNFGSTAQLVSAANSVFAIDHAARIIGRYDKAHLVPYGEYLPMPWLLRPLGLARLVPGDMDFIAGPGPRTLRLPGFGAIGVQLCYEIVFSGEVIDQAHRPRLLFNPSNDAWFGAWGPPQHLAQARMRAIEEGLPIVRATPNGISAMIAADGTLLATIAHKTAGAIELPIPAALPPTLFARAGNWMAVLAVALMLLAAVAIRRRAR